MELKNGMEIRKDQLKDAINSLEDGQTLVVEFETEDDEDQIDDNGMLTTMSEEEKAMHAQEIEDLLSPADVEDMINGGTGEVPEDEEQ